MGWGSKAYLRNPRKIPCGSGERAKGFQEPAAAAMSWYGQRGTSLGQSLAFPAEMLQPQGEAGVLGAVFLLFLWLGAFSGWQWGICDCWSFPCLLRKTAPEKHHTTAPGPAPSKSPLCTNRLSCKMPLASSHTGNCVERGLVHE